MKRVGVEKLSVGDKVKAVEHGPEGEVTDANRAGWTIVGYAMPGGGKAVVSYEHHKEGLFLLDGQVYPSARDKRADFLAGEGTLTAAEVGEWASEMGSNSRLPSGFPEHQPLMVSIAHGGPAAELTDGELDKALAEMAQWTRLPYGVAGEHVVVLARTEAEAQQLNRTAMRRILAAART